MCLHCRKSTLNFTGELKRVETVGRFSGGRKLIAGPLLRGSVRYLLSTWQLGLDQRVAAISAASIGGVLDTIICIGGEDFFGGFLSHGASVAIVFFNLYEVMVIHDDWMILGVPIF